MVLGNTEDRKSEAAITNPPAPNLLLLFGIKSSFRDVLPTRARAAPRNSKWGAVGEGGCGGGGCGGGGLWGRGAVGEGGCGGGGLWGRGAVGEGGCD